MDTNWVLKLIDAAIGFYIVLMVLMFIVSSLVRLAGSMYRWAREGWQPTEKISDQVVAEVPHGR